MLKVFSLCVILLGLPGLQGSVPLPPVQVTLSNPHFDIISWQAVAAHLQSLGITRPDEVTHLTLHQCNLKRLPAWVTDKMPNLKHLNIADNAITALPENIDRLTKLMHLEAHHNHMTALPASLSTLSRLELADFRYNKLKNLSKASFNMPNLRALALSHNQISTLPDLSGLKNLQGLLLEHNEDIRFEPGSKPLQSLNALDLSHCNLKTVPSFLGDFSKLNKLNLAGNPLLEKGSGDKWGKEELKQRFADKVRF